MIAKAVGCLTNGFMTVVCAFPANGKRNARYIIFLIMAYVEDNLSERVAFNVSLGLQVFDQAAVQAAIDKVMAETYVLQDKEVRRINS